MKRLVLLLFLSALPALCAYPNGYTYQYVWTIQAGQVPATQSDFPLVVCVNGIGHGCNLTVPALAGQFTSSNCYDAIWTSDSAGTTVIPFELAPNTCNAAGGGAEWWIAPSTVAAGMSIYLWVGNSNVTTNQGWPMAGSSPWPASYVGVYHLGGSGTLNLTDSTGNSNGTNSGATAVTGNLGGGVNFVTAGSQSFKVTNQVTSGNSITLSTWFNSSVANTNAAIDQRGNAGENGCVLFTASPSGVGSFYCNGFGGVLAGSASLTDGNWHYLVGVISAGSSAIYIDGVAVASHSEALAGFAAGSTYFGRSSDATPAYMTGSVDEAHISKAGTSLNWVTLEYNNQSNQAAFWSIAGPFGSSTVSVTPAAIPANHAANITLTLAGTGTNWSAGTTFGLSGVTGVAKISQNVVSATSATVVIATGTGTGTLIVSDGTSSGNTSVGTATLSVVPGFGASGGAVPVTLTGVNTVWTQENASTLFSLSGTTGSTFGGTPVVSSNTNATALINLGASSGATTITDNTTGATTTISSIGSACAGYAYSATLTVAQVTGNLANFPVVVSLTIPPQYVLSPQGDDICISDPANTTAMPIQWLSSYPVDGPVHEWNWQSGKANFIFNAPTLSSTAPTTFTIWAGNPFVLNTNPDTNSAWDSSTLIAAHLQEPMFPMVNSATGATITTGRAPVRTTGQIGFAQQFASAASQVLPIVGSPATGGPMASLLFQTAYSGSTGEYLADSRGALSCGTGMAPALLVQSRLLKCAANGNILSGTMAVNDGAWHHAACGCSASGCALYLDGTQAASNGAGFTVGVAGVTVGGSCASDGYFDGKLEELRFAPANARPAAWVAAEAINLLHPATFVTIGSWSFSGGSGPAISGVSLAANSQSSLVAKWTTSTPATSRVLCATTSGGPYTYFTPLLHPVKNGAAFWGQTNHTVAITGLHTATQYYCVFQSIDVNGYWSTSSELSATTSVALPSTPLTVAWSAAPTRPNDAGTAPSGANGLPYTGCWFDGDTQYSTWAADGNQYGMTEDGGGPNNGHGTGGGLLWLRWNDPNHLCGTWIAGVGNTCAGPACSGTPYNDGYRWASQGPVSVNGTIYQGLERYSGNSYCCTSIIKSSDGWAHSLSPQDNTGPSAVAPAGIDMPTQGNVMWSRTQLHAFVQVGQDHNSGGTFPNIANNDGWVYDVAPDAWGNDWPMSLWAPTLWRVRVEDLPLLDASKFQLYTCPQSADDGIYDNCWSYDYTQETLLNQANQSFPGSFSKYSMTFVPDFNRFLWATNPQAPGDLTAGTVIWDAQYPWSVPTAVANVPRHPTFLNHFPGFGQLLSATYAKASSMPLAAHMTLSTASGYPQNGTAAMDDYSTLTYFLNLAPRPAGPARPLVGSNSRTAHISSGLDLFYNFRGSGGDIILPNLAPSDSTGQYSASVGTYWTCGSNPTVFHGFFYDQYGMYNFGYPGTVPWTGTCPYAVATPYAANSTAFTALVVFAHYPATAPYYSGLVTIATPLGETVLSKGADLSIQRHGSSLNSGWDVTVGGAAINTTPLACNDGSFCAFVVRRDTGNNVTVYRSGSIQSALPLSADAIGTAAGAWSSSPLIFGDSNNSLIGVMSEALVWNRALSDAELIHEMTVTRSDMAARGVVLP